MPRETGLLLSLLGGAILGAYLAGTLATALQGAGSLSHSIAGALAGGIVAVEVYKAARGIRASTGGALVAPLAAGIVVGRWGCLFAGLPDGTFGTPSALPWGIDLGDGVARHPVQIYESLSVAGFLAAYLWGLAVRAPWALAHGFHAMILWYAAQRFAWEFLKPYPSVLGPLNVFHLICGGLFVYGLVWIARARRAAPVAP
jgi:prolipoprotein diacylglyceryltransferase